MRLILELAHDTGGQDMVEYAVLTSLISLTAVVAVTSIGTTVSTVFQTIADQLEQ